MKLKRVLSTVLAFTTLVIGTFSTFGTANAVEVETKDTPQASKSAVKSESSAETLTAAEIETLKNKLCDNIEDGVILHAWCWSFNTIKENMAEIAAAGYTAVQTSPANACASDTNKNLVLMGINNGTEDGSLGAWWWHYQPTDWTIGNYQLGSRQDYIDMCEAAEIYGVKIITDVLPNHTTSDKSLVSQNFINAVSKTGDINDLYHSDSLRFGYLSNNRSRRQSTLCNSGGLPDVNTENPDFQYYFLQYCNDLIACGCDGFRFDTAKHIGVSSDPIDPKNTGGVNDFWDVATGQKSVTNSSNQTISLNNKDNLFLYGEILQGDNIPYSEYAKYMRMTASNYGYDIRNAIKNNNFTVDSYIKTGNYNHSISKDRLITWVESHDTYCNEHISANLTSEQIRLAWAAIAARKEGTPLFFNRPANSSSSNLWGDNVIGKAGNDEWKTPEIAEVNKFRNAMACENESLSSFNGGTVLKIDRGDKGSCIINVGSSAYNFSNVSTSLKNGTYTDRVAGTSTFTVTNGKISGAVAARSVAVIYNTSNLKASPATAEFSDTLNVALSNEEIKEGTNVHYTVTVGSEEKASGDFSGKTNITIGDNINSSCEITVTLTATDKNNIPITKTYKYTKYRENDYQYIYFDNNRYNWSTVSAYVYKDSNTYNATWPGEPMTYDSNTGYFKYKVPYNLKGSKVRFYSTDSNIYPPQGTSGLSIGSTDKIFKYFNQLVDYTQSVQPDVPQVKEPDTYIYFFDSMGWSDYAINAYMWKGSGSSEVKNADWPGEQMSWSDDLHCYYYAYNSSDKFENIIFNGKKKIYINGSGDFDYECKTETILLKSNEGKVFVPSASNQDDTHKEIVYTTVSIEPNQIQSHKVYYNNSANSWGSVNVYTWGGNNTTEQKNAVWPGECANYIGNNIFSYTYYYPKVTDSGNENFEKIIFNDGKVDNQTGDLNIPTDKNNPVYNASWSDVTSIKSTIPINFYYTDHRVAETNSSGSETYKEQECMTKVYADTSNKNLDSAIAAALLSTKDSNLYDEYEGHASQFDYVKSLASTSDSRLGSSITNYGAVYHPSILAHSSNVFSGIYNNSIGTLDSAVLSNPKWVTYYDSQGKEIAYENILPDLSNLDHIDIRALSMPKNHGVTFYYPNADTTLTSFNNNTLYVAKDNRDSNTKVTKSSYKCNYNDIYSENANDYAELTKGMYIPAVDGDKCVFDGWYMIEFDSSNNVKSYIKVSSELEYKYRITSDMKLYAVFKKSASTAKGAAVPKSDVDIFTDNNDSNTVKYRFNTMLNVYNCADYDLNDENKITDVAVIYVKLGANDTYNLDTVRDSLKNNFSSNGTVNINNGTAPYISYSYKVGSQVQLTAKNRLQFILNLTESQITSGNYKNVLAFTAFKTGNIWIISDNCINYKNGEANLVMITN